MLTFHAFMTRLLSIWLSFSILLRHCFQEDLISMSRLEKKFNYQNSNFFNLLLTLGDLIFMQEIFISHFNCLTVKKMNSFNTCRSIITHRGTFMGRIIFFCYEKLFYRKFKENNSHLPSMWIFSLVTPFKNCFNFILKNLPKVRSFIRSSPRILELIIVTCIKIFNNLNNNLISIFFCLNNFELE